jgi:hypothetical protein
VFVKGSHLKFQNFIDVLVSSILLEKDIHILSLPIQLNNLTFPIHQLMIDEASLHSFEHFQVIFFEIIFQIFCR